jgi:steroid delta-isomerase-like uncharacterized protein
MATSTEAPTGTSNGELVRWSFEMLNRHDVEALKQFWTAETVERFPDRTLNGIGEIAPYFQEAFDALADFRIEPLTITEQGDDVFVQWRITGTHTGVFAGIEPTGKRLALDGMDHFVIRDGKVVSNFVVYDRMQFAQQLGMMAQDGSAGERAMRAAFNARTKLAAKLRR